MAIPTLHAAKLASGNQAITQLEAGTSSVALDGRTYTAADLPAIYAIRDWLAVKAALEAIEIGAQAPSPNPSPSTAKEVTTRRRRGPTQLADLLARARTEGATAERTRILGVEQLARPDSRRSPPRPRPTPPAR